jgi:BAI1-associated protein 3
MIGCDSKKINQFQLVEHLRKAFQIEPKQHLELYNQVSAKPNPSVKLSLGIIEAKDLVSKDISGTNNPYCTFYVSSSKESPQSTSCKPQTLNPVWNETFTMDVANKDQNESLHIDVWNFDPGDGIVDQLKRVGEVKDSRSLKLLISNTVAPQSGDKLIGHIEIQLATLPACGTNKWWTLSKMDGKVKKERGEIHLIQHLFTREDQLTEHTRLLKVLLSHELIKRNCAAYTWRDNFSKETLQILAQHAIQSRMSRVDTALTRLLVYCQMHLVLPLDCRVFIPILEKLRKPVLANQIPEQMVQEFHETSEKLVGHFTTFIR